MNRIILALGVGCSMVMAVAAADPRERSPEASVYLNLEFGGNGAGIEDAHYGLRIDHVRRYVDRQFVPSMLQVDFSQQGSRAYLNGVNLRSPTHRLGQFEDETVEETEEGFFEGIWGSVTGFFGFGDDDDEEEAADDSTYETAEAGDEAYFMGYNVVDWAVLAVGAAGLGFVASEVSDSQDSPDVQTQTPSQSGGGGLAGGGDGGGGLAGSGLVGGLTDTHRMRDVSIDRERLEWLDGGTGQMGDLTPVD